MEILILVLIVGYLIYDFFVSLYYKLPHIKKQQRIRIQKILNLRNQKNIDYLLGKNKLDEYHYHQDYDLITRYEKGVEKCWSNYPSVWIGDEVELLWYYDTKNFKKNLVHSEYKVIGFDEYKIIESDELVIERRKVRKNYDTTKLLEIGDTIYLELVTSNNMGVVKRTLSILDLSFDYSNKLKHTGELSKEDLKIITFKDQNHLQSDYPHIILLKQMIKNIIVLKSIKSVDEKYISKWRFYTHLSLCRHIPIDIEKKDIYSTVMKLDKYILSFNQREMNLITKSQYFSEINNSILERP